jgi:hypothetical protein
VLGLFMQFFIKYLELGTAFFLGVKHGRIGIPQDIFGQVIVFGVVSCPALN